MLKHMLRNFKVGDMIKHKEDYHTIKEIKGQKLVVDKDTTSRVGRILGEHQKETMMLNKEECEKIYSIGKEFHLLVDDNGSQFFLTYEKMEEYIKKELRENEKYQCELITCSSQGILKPKLELGVSDKQTKYDYNGLYGSFIR